jgi:LCP family protein required for cell wall assembly
MRPDDERDDEQPEESTPDDEHAGEHELPPPATWAGRQQSGAAKGADGGDAAEEPPEAEAPADQAGDADEEDPGSGFTEEFDSIERDLDDELTGLGEYDEEDATEKAEAGEDEAADAPAAKEAEEAEPEAAEAESAEPEAAEPEATEPPSEEADEVPEPTSSETVEAETPELADREEAREAAMAGLQARAADHGESWEAKPGAEAEALGATVAAPEGDAAAEAEKPGRARPVWARFIAASFLIVASVAAATSISLLVYLTEIADGLSDNDRLANLDEQLTEVDGGDPQTMLILGSDERLDLPGDKRSDTTILLRVDPDQNKIALLSIPRDLKVSIPGHGVDKFNAAYSLGQAKLTLRVVKQLTGLDVQHVVNINFTGFADAVNAIDCVYVDVDRRYYIPEEDEVAEIDIEAGYQRMCGYKALQYVRYRHDDNDLVRSARQQDFLREARQNIDAAKILEDGSYRNRLIDIFTEHTTSDIRDPVTMLELMRTFVGAADATVEEVHFPADLGDANSVYVNASDEAIQGAVDQFLSVEGTPGERPAGESEEPEEAQEEKPDEEQKDGEKKEEEETEQDFVGPEMLDSTEQGQVFANKTEKKKTKSGDEMIDFPVFYPTRLIPESILSRASRAFVIDGPDKEKYFGYKMVAEVPGYQFGNGLFEEYYGVSGTDWKDAPILDNPSETRKIDGRDYQLYYDGDRLRLVAFKTDDAAYWVNNTLSQSLSEGQMLSIATSMREFD